MPEGTARAVALLVEWDRSGAFATVGCTPPPSVRALVYVLRAALEAATTADDPRVHAVLRLGQALRSPDNGPFVIMFGIGAATDVAAWRHRRALSETADMRALAPDGREPRAAALAEVRCGLAQLETLRAAFRADPSAVHTLEGARREYGLDEVDDPIDVDLDAAKAYLEETRALIARTPSDAALGDALARRAERVVKDSRSATAHIVSPFVYAHVLDELARYRAAAAGRDDDARP
jgi:hypothetical protein